MVELDTGYVPRYILDATITAAKSPGSAKPETADEPDHYFTIVPPAPHDDTVLVGHVNIERQRLMLRVNTLGANGGNGEIQWLTIPERYRLNRKDADSFSIIRAIAASFGYKP